VSCERKLPAAVVNAPCSLAHESAVPNPPPGTEAPEIIRARHGSGRGAECIVCVAKAAHDARLVPGCRWRGPVGRPRTHEGGGGKGFRIKRDLIGSRHSKTADAVHVDSLAVSGGTAIGAERRPSSSPPDRHNFGRHMPTRGYRSALFAGDESVNRLWKSPVDVSLWMWNRGLQSTIVGRASSARRASRT